MKPVPFVQEYGGSSSHGTITTYSSVDEAECSLFSTFRPIKKSKKTDSIIRYRTLFRHRTPKAFHINILFIDFHYI